jgi:glycosyltransferase involved in cell wall biosynthesis
LISIITINYNNAAGLEKTISSVLGQTDTHFRWIVIDGGSTDGSAELIKKNENRITYWISEKDKGIYHAMNKGTAAVNDGYCYYLNSGDVFFNNKVIEELRPYLDGSGLIAGNVELVLPSGEKKQWKTKSRYRVSEIAYGHLPHQGFFYHRSLFDRFGFYDEHLRIVSDWGFLLKLIIGNVPIHSTPLTFARHSLDGISNNASHAKLQEEEREKVLQSFSSLEEDLNEIHLSKNLPGYLLHRLSASIRYRLKKS